MRPVLLSRSDNDDGPTASALPLSPSSDSPPPSPHPPLTAVAAVVRERESSCEELNWPLGEIGHRGFPTTHSSDTTSSAQGLQNSAFFF